jgi:hypothetical protein
MSSTGDLKRVLAELPHFQIRSREDLLIAERMLALLIRNLDALSAKQKLLAKAFKTEVERNRARWGDPPAGSKGQGQ